MKFKGHTDKDRINYNRFFAIIFFLIGWAIVYFSTFLGHANEKLETFISVALTLGALPASVGLIAVANFKNSVDQNIAFLFTLSAPLISLLISGNYLVPKFREDSHIYLFILQIVMILIYVLLVYFINRFRKNNTNNSI